MLYFSTRLKGRDFLRASAELASGWRMRYVMVGLPPSPQGWVELRGGDRRSIIDFSVQDMRKLEKVELFDLMTVTSAMFEKERLWKRVTESAVLGETSASGEAEGSILL